ncbi:MAG: SprT family zinc-dependent metalloprotease [Patescibacteria group bacterium]
MTDKINIDGIGDIWLTSRKGSRSLRLSLKPDGRVVLNVPKGISRKIAEDFLNSKLHWIIKNRINPDILIQNQQIGKAHRLAFYVSKGTRVSSRIIQNEISIFSGQLDFNHPDVQKVVKNVAKKALILEAKQLLPQRLEHLAKKHNLVYDSLQIKHHKTRWGVCDSHKNIILNCFLLQLPWHLIDYVIIHELSHTVHMSHSKDFWIYVESLLPSFKDLRRELKQYRPSF